MLQRYRSGKCQRMPGVASYPTFPASFAYLSASRLSLLRRPRLGFLEELFSPRVVRHLIRLGHRLRFEALHCRGSGGQRRLVFEDRLGRLVDDVLGDFVAGVCTENVIRGYEVMESAMLIR